MARLCGSAGLSLAPLGSARQSPARLSSAGLSSVRRGSAQHGSVELGSAQDGSAELRTAQHSSAVLNSARLGSLQSGAARLGAGRGELKATSPRHRPPERPMAGRAGPSRAAEPAPRRAGPRGCTGPVLRLSTSPRAAAGTEPRRRDRAVRPGRCGPGAVPARPSCRLGGSGSRSQRASPLRAADAGFCRGPQRGSPCPDTGAGGSGPRVVQRPGTAAAFGLQPDFQLHSHQQRRARSRTRAGCAAAAFAAAVTTWTGSI